MKKVLAGIALVLFTCILLGLLLYKLVFSTQDSTKAQPTTQQDPFIQVSSVASEIHTGSPSETAQTCFKWYINAIGYGADGLSAQSRQESGKCFTQDFISQWDTIISSTNADPILLAQYIGSTWNIVAVSGIGESVDSSDQLVTMGIGDTQNKVIAHVVRDRTTDSWKIASVTVQ